MKEERKQVKGKRTDYRSIDNTIIKNILRNNFMVPVHTLGELETERLYTYYFDRTKHGVM